MGEAYSYLYSIPYVIYMLFLIGCFYFEKKRLAQGENAEDIRKVVLFSALVFIGLRGHVMTDYISYYPYFKEMPTFQNGKLTDFSRYGRIEFGFLYYTYFIKSIFRNYFIWVFINTLIDLFIINQIFKKYTSYYALAFIVFIGFQGLGLEINTYRNIKAIVLFMLSLQYIRKKKFVPYLLLNLLGFTFHASALIYIPMYFILNRKISKMMIWALFVISNCIFLLHIKLSSVIIPPLIDLTGMSVSISKIMTYLNTSSSYGISVGYVERILSFTLFTIFSDKMIEKTEMNRIFYNSYLLYFFFFFFFSDMSVFAERFSGLFVFSYWVLYPNVYKCINKVEIKKVFISYLLFLSLFKVITGNSVIFSKYDNLLFGIQSFEQRESVFNQYNKQIFNQ
ncbi:EpsG family protein [Maribellus maritimus]|uniref:EpsG family protein n=1 Tax=Maribellus maritimus TaxID=2870838 RepID=UPI001EEB86C2|nr:EpsG family protein [Maribellus maritimus]MCG6188441.1 EpsG family protein [Maribellus maritimus]